MKYKNEIVQGDCLEVMAGMEANSVDTVICDPPYDLAFMGKSWDSTGVAFKKATWEDALRVAKPGATLLAFGGTRTYHRLACAIEDAGWVIKDCLMWIYGSGFPKSTDISKQLDKGHERKVVGKVVKGKDRIETPITEPATPQAQLWNGWKSHGLKPAYEPILVAMKPNDGTYAANALKHGVAGLNIEGGRIPLNGDKKVGGFGDAKSGYQKGIGKSGDPDYKTTWKEDTKGRFPSNVILNEEARRLLDLQSGVSKSSKRPPTSQPKSGDIYGKYIDYGYERGHNDSGGASRFFYCAKASKAERNAGCEGLEKKQTTGGGGGVGDYLNDVNSMSGKYGSEKAPAKNNHPTVKPLALMKYLCILTKTPTGGLVLDPFAGSGTTCMAAKLTGRDFVGIEKEAEYCEIARRRVEATHYQPDLFGICGHRLFPSFPGCTLSVGHSGFHRHQPRPVRGDGGEGREQ